KLLRQPGDFCCRNQLAIDLNPFAKGNQMRRRKQADVETSRPVDAFEHGAGGAFAIGSSHMNKAEPILGVTSESGQLKRIGETKLGSKPSQTIQKFNSVWIRHRSYHTKPQETGRANIRVAKSRHYILTGLLTESFSEEFVN